MIGLALTLIGVNATFPLMQRVDQVQGLSDVQFNAVSFAADNGLQHGAGLLFLHYNTDEHQDAAKARKWALKWGQSDQLGSRRKAAIGVLSSPVLNCGVGDEALQKTVSSWVSQMAASDPQRAIAQQSLKKVAQGICDPIEALF